MDAEQGGVDLSSDDTNIIQLPSPYQSEESRYSDDSCAAHDDPMEASCFDDYDDDSYYDMSSHYEDSSYETFHFALDDTGNELTNESIAPISENLSPIIEIGSDGLEENNNDPNNNMDSIEINGVDGPTIVTDQSFESGIYMDRSVSPIPGCSKDSAPLLSANKSHVDDEVTREHTEHVLHVISKIHHDSIFEALKKRPKVATSELKLWDLVPENERLEYPPLVNGSKNLATEMRSRDDAEVGNFTKTKTSSATSVTTGTASTVKRGPVEDICTVGCKKSSSEPDISIALPKLIAQAPGRKTFREPKAPMPPPKATIGEPKSTLPGPKVTLPGPKVTLPASKGMSHIPQPSVKANVQNQIAKARREDPVCRDRSAYRVNIKLPPSSSSVVSVTTAKFPPSPVINVDPPRRQVLQTASATTANSRGAIPKLHYQPRQNLPQAHEGWTQQVNSCRFHGSSTMDDVWPSTLTPEYGSTWTETAVTKVHSNAAKNAITAGPSATTPATAIAGTGAANVIPAEPFLPTTSQQKHPQQQQQPTKKVVCMEMYYKLRNIFPNIDPHYIRNLCPADWAPGDRDSQLAPLVEHLLENGDSLPLAPIKLPDTDEAEQASGINSGNVDDIYENLLGIFPDADPHYLREFSERNLLKPNAVKEFVESSLQHRNYPTREQYMAKLKITEQQRQYTTGFNVKQYLTIISDPSKHFMDAKRKCKHSTVALEFLKSYFNKIRVSTISKFYNQCDFNLSLTAEALEHISSEMKSKRGCYEIPTEDILLLQEIAFIKHKSKIDEHIANVERVEKAEFKMLKKQNLLVECQCCYDFECVPSKCSSCDNGHLFCNNCIITGTNSKIGDGETRISCFANCGSEFSLSVLQRILAPTTFSILLKKRQAAEVIEAGLEGLVSCPFCHFSSIPPEEDKIFKCLNPECTKESCRLCKELSHVPLKCNEVMKADKARRYVEEKMTQALARTCYKCQRAFFKEEGCNKITCPCGAMMCYLCDQPIQNYSHFRGQGSDAKDLCPLYSDTIRLDAVAVRKVAEQAQIELMKLDPNIKVDTTKLLPNIPRPTIGPHTAVLNADELPRRAQRVFDLQPPPL